MLRNLNSLKVHCGYLSIHGVRIVEKRALMLGKVFPVSSHGVKAKEYHMIEHNSSVRGAQQHLVITLVLTPI